MAPNRSRQSPRRNALRILILVAGLLAAAVTVAVGVHLLVPAEASPAAAEIAGDPANTGADEHPLAPRPSPQPSATAPPAVPPSKPAPPRIDWRNSEAIGIPEAGRLRHGVALPAAGRYWVSWDPVLRRSPNRRWRRFGTDRLLRATLAIMRDFGGRHPGASRVAIGDLSRPQGGDFGPQFGYIGHATHQNGLDIDVYYPRTDGREKPPESVDQVDVPLAQELVDRFVAAGAETVYVGPNLPLTGPAGVVIPLVNHDNHLHARLPPEG